MIVIPVLLILKVTNISLHTKFFEAPLAGIAAGGTQLSIVINTRRTTPVASGTRISDSYTAGIGTIHGKCLATDFVGTATSTARLVALVLLAVSVIGATARLATCF